MIHQAGPMVHGLQLCERCGYVLTDYRDAMVPASDAAKPLTGWHEGASVEVTHYGGARFSDLVEEAPNCEPAH